MINEILVASISLFSFFGGSDEKASQIKGESAFSCEQVNLSISREDYKAAHRMADLVLRQLDEAYVADSTIETFYREQLRNGPIRYKYLFKDLIFDTCMQKPKIGVLEASTHALNEAYKFSASQVDFALCKELIETKISFDSLVEHTTSRQVFRPTHSSDWLVHPTQDELSRIGSIRKYHLFDASELKDKISKKCAAAPNSPALESMVEAWLEIGQEMQNIFEAEQEKIRMAEQEIEAQKEAEREKEIFKLYSTSLYVSPETSNCGHLNGQQSAFAFSNDPARKEVLRKGLVATLEDAIALMLPHQQVKLRAKLENDSSTFFQEVRDNCVSMLNGSESIHSSLNRIVSPKLPSELEPRSSNWVADEAVVDDAVRNAVASSTYASPRPSMPDVVRSTSQSSSTTPVASHESKEQEREVAVSPASERNSPPVLMPKADPFNQTAVINDPDGYTNVRIEASGKGKIISRILQNERFYTYEQSGSWWAVRKTDGLLGYVHKSRITLLP